MLSGGAGQSSLRTSGDRRAEVVRQNLERAVAPHRRRLSAEAKATVRFEMPPGHQLQIDFGVSTVLIVGEPMRAHLFHAGEGCGLHLQHIENILLFWLFGGSDPRVIPQGMASTECVSIRVWSM